jgi:NTP pyrophosphatase (non-canonical NTP hydrolase)
MNLSNQIMNLPCVSPARENAYGAYERGHRAARHAAAELALSASLLERFEKNCDRLFVKPDDHVGKLVHAAMGVAGEGGELLDAVKKHWVYGKELDRENILEECGDAMFYIAVLLKHCGYTLEQAMQHNMAKLNKRYPEGYSDIAAQTRADKA